MDGVSVAMSLMRTVSNSLKCCINMIMVVLNIF